VLKEVVALYQNSQAVRDAIRKAFASNDKLYALSWK
jgi:D-methionine transport system substrate-binding protein